MICNFHVIAMQEVFCTFTRAQRSFLRRTAIFLLTSLLSRLVPFPPCVPPPTAENIDCHNRIISSHLHPSLPMSCARHTAALSGVTTIPLKHPMRLLYSHFSLHVTDITPLTCLDYNGITLSVTSCRLLCKGTGS